VLVAAVVAFSWRLRSPDDSLVAERAALSQRAGLQWRPGTAQQYDLAIDSAMHIVATRANAAQDIGVHMRCLLDALTLQADRDAIWVGIRLETVELRVAGKTDAATNAALTAPFRVRFTAAGMPEAFEFPAGLSSENRLILENLVRTFQVTAQAGAEWVAQETNSSGAYEAAYRRIDSSRVEKAKRGFVGTAVAPVYRDADLASNESFSTDVGRDWLTAMTVDETVTTKGQGSPPMKITNHAMLALRPAAQVAANATLWAFAAAAEPTAVGADPSAPPALTREQAEGQIRAALADLDAATEGRTVFIHRLRDLLRVDGALPAALLTMLQTEPLTDRTRADVYLAFELAGTNEAQAALTSVVGSPAWSLRDSLRAIVALSGVVKPSDATVAALWSTAQSSPATADGAQLSSTATFALGSLGKTLSTARNPDYSLLRSRLLGGAMGGASVQERANFVRALGNTHDASLTRGVVGLLDDSSPAVRRAAALSLGSLDTNEAAVELLSHLTREPSGEVRGAIAESLASWTAPTSAAAAEVRAAVRAEAEENARYNMAVFLGKNLDRFPENRPVLQELLRTEQSQRIRQSVATALAGPR